MKFGIVNRQTSGYFCYQGWPTVAKAEDGTLYAASSGHRLDHVCPFGKNLMYISHDEGETWSSPIIVNDTHLDDRDAGLVCWGDGNIMLSWFNNELDVFEHPGRQRLYPNIKEPFSQAMLAKWVDLPKEEFGSFTRISRDGGKTWSKQRKAPVTCPHGPIRRKDGSFLYVGAERLSGYEGIPANAICAVESHDDGETWQLLSALPTPKEHNGCEISGVCEPHCIELDDGVILAAIRCFLLKDNRSVDQYYFTVYTCRSTNGGKTWDEPVFMERFGAPPHFMKHSSGALILSCSKRTAPGFDPIEPNGQYARISWDNGLTWEEDIMISPEAPAPSVDQGYASTVELSNGDLFTTYYQRFPGDEYPSILYTRWTLPEKK